MVTYLAVIQSVGIKLAIVFFSIYTQTLKKQIANS